MTIRDAFRRWWTAGLERGGRNNFSDGLPSRPAPPPPMHPWGSSFPHFDVNVPMPTSAQALKNGAAMRLWLLRRSDRRCIYDTNDGFVVRAENEAAARTLANSQAADEGAIWEDPSASTCAPLDHDGSRGVVLIDFHAG